jgi:hypothetical protein
MPPWRRCSRLPDVLVSLAEGPPGRADLARRRAITLQAGSHTGGPGTRSGPLLAIAAGQAARNGLCRPPGGGPRLHGIQCTQAAVSRSTSLRPVQERCRSMSSVLNRLMVDPSARCPGRHRPTRSTRRSRPRAGLGERQRCVLGGFKWSSQHLERGGACGQTGWVDEGVDGQVGDEVTGRAVSSPGRGAGVLA